MDRETLRARLDRPLKDSGDPPEQVIADLIADAEGGVMGSSGGRFFGWVIGGSVDAALAADWLAALWDQNSVTYQSGPAAALVEEIAGGWLKEILGIPADASYAFVTGCQMAHVTCMAAARHALLERRGWDVEQKGLSGAPLIRILASTEVHGTSERAVRFLGLGAGNLCRLQPMRKAACARRRSNRPSRVRRMRRPSSSFRLPISTSALMMILPG